MHEIKPVLGQGRRHWIGSWAAAQSLVLALAGRRLAGMMAGGQGMLWCVPAPLALEFGHLYGGGLAAFGLDPSQVLVAVPHSSQDMLWTLEEGLNAPRFAGTRLGLVVGLVSDVALTPARRLALAAERSQTPCLLVTSPDACGIAATSTRWRVDVAASAPAPGLGPLPRHAPGALRLAVALERCRARSALAGETWRTVEWSDEAYRFRVVPDVADRADISGRISAGAAR